MPRQLPWRRWTRFVRSGFVWRPDIPPTRRSWIDWVKSALLWSSMKTRWKRWILPWNLTPSTSAPTSTWPMSTLPWRILTPRSTTSNRPQTSILTAPRSARRMGNFWWRADGSLRRWPCSTRYVQCVSPLSFLPGAFLLFLPSPIGGVGLFSSLSRAPRIIRNSGSISRECRSKFSSFCGDPGAFAVENTNVSLVFFQWVCSKDFIRGLWGLCCFIPLCWVTFAFTRELYP